MALLKSKKSSSQITKKHDGIIWKTIYSDLMTNLMLFFLMLYGITRLNGQEKKAAEMAVAAKFKNTQIEAQANKFKTEEEAVSDIKQEVGSEHVSISIDEQRIKIRLSSLTLFDSGDAELKDQAKSILKQISDNLKEIDNSIIVEGHTDNVPINTAEYASNWELSTARAFHVIDYFVKQGIAPRRFSAAGYGEYRPLFSNDSKDNKLNRRIEISILRKKKKIINE